MLPQSPTQSLHSFVFRSQHMCVAAASAAASASAAAAAAGWKCCNFAAYPGNYVSRRSSSSIAAAAAVETAAAAPAKSAAAAAAAASSAAAAARTTTTAMLSQWIRRQIKTKLNEKIYRRQGTASRCRREKKRVKWRGERWGSRTRRCNEAAQTAELEDGSCACSVSAVRDTSLPNKTLQMFFILV